MTILPDAPMIAIMLTVVVLAISTVAQLRRRS